MKLNNENSVVILNRLVVNTIVQKKFRCIDVGLCANVLRQTTKLKQSKTSVPVFLGVFAHSHVYC